MRAARPELEPDQDADGHQQQPGGEKQVHGKGQHGERQDGDKDSGDDPKHVDRSPFTMS